MSDCCGPIQAKTGKFRKIVWIALAVNLSMFFYEFGASFLADSSALKADALDFLGDSANYGIGLFVLNLSLTVRASASLIKGLTMGAFGLWVLGAAAWSVIAGASPVATTMGWVGFFALIANIAVALLLYEFREGDSNMKSVWLCSRNDAIGNIAVILAAGAVYLTNSLWPDVIVAGLMAYLGLSASTQVIRLARNELQSPGLNAATQPKCRN